MKWEQQQRLTILELTVLFRGQLTTKALTKTFGVGRVQASKDFTFYQLRFPENLEYNRKKKCYLPTAQFEPGFLPKNGDEMLKMFCQYIQPEAFLFFGENQFNAALEVITPINRVMDWQVVSRLSQAIHQEKIIRIEYQAMSREDPNQREIAPHSFVFNGYRWHVRAYCLTKKKYQDFLPTRILGVPQLGDEAPFGVSEDRDWNETVEVVLVPNPQYAVNRKQVIAHEYGMEDGQLKIVLKKALVGYYLQYLRLDHEDAEKDPYQQIFVLNREALRPYIWF